MSDTLKLTPTESVTVRRSDPELLEVEATYGSAGKQPPKHFHPEQDVAGQPEPVVRGLLAITAVFGRMRGYGPGQA